MERRGVGLADGFATQKINVSGVVQIAKNATDLHTDIKFVKKNCP